MELPKRFTNGISNDFGNLSRKVEDEVMVGGECLFYQQRDGPLMPTLRLVHKYPTMMPAVQVDKGAIKFVLKGANIMCPGKTTSCIATKQYSAVKAGRRSRVHRWRM